ncbi:PH domain-like protein [Massarina eburnea CBS 473.64]|uniref:PH domain-like protein n=1 Tax=Massarina eburnea CBS 473.64 TaxID=1395130 RepID=A0A6A6SDS8_9PLEO|nr:PH domain-like protein [Massarina eburnea CBS 473.64]
MAATAGPQTQQTPSTPIAVRPQMKIEPPIASSRLESTITYKPELDVMSPVNQNGSFEFDRVIKRGGVVKRTRKTKQWKSVYIVLRPNLLSIYRDKDETKLRHQISLSDLTAVARQRDSKKKMAHVFAIFSPARNYHFAAPTEKEAQAWVDVIRAEARIDEGDDEMLVMSPQAKKGGFGPPAKRDTIGSSSSEAEPRHSGSMAAETVMHSAARRTSHTLSANEYASYSDFSDTGTSGPTHQAFEASMTSLPRTSTQMANTSEHSNVGTMPDDDRVIYHGWLWVLKSKGGVRQWKKVWVVLRPKALGLYKNGQEYSASRIIPFASIIDAVDIDAASKTKQHCMQVISEEKNYRFCAADEETLAKWLGAFKSLLVKRKERQQQPKPAAQAQAQAQPTAAESRQTHAFTPVENRAASNSR